MRQKEVNEVIKYMTHDGLSIPFVECDACAKPIMDVKDGEAIWSKAGEIKFTHHNPCSRAFDWRNGFPYWEPLEVFFRHLMHNTKVDGKPSESAKAYMDMFGDGVPRKAVRK